MNALSFPYAARANQDDRTGSVRFRLSPIAAVIAGMGLMMVGSLHAAEEKSVAELEAEVARWKQAYEKSQQQLAAQKAAASASQPVVETSASTGVSPAAPATSAAPASGTVGLDTFVVRASSVSRPIETLLDTSSSVSIVSGDELEKLGAVNVKEIFNRLGNVQWNYGNPKTGSMSIRGVSSGSSENIDPSLGVVVDNVPYAYVALASGSDYVDIDTVDVRRGPQGTDGGRATTMGVIDFKTRRPTFNPEAYASVTFGSYNNLSSVNGLLTQGALGGPVVDGLLAWRGTFYRNQQEGAYKNAYFDIQDRTSYGNADRSYGRVQFLLTPSSSFEGLFSFDYKPNGIEFVNGLTVRNAYPTPYYANGTNFNDVTSNGVQTKLARRYFSSANAYTYNDYLNTAVNEDQNKGILNGNQGFSANLTWKLPNHTLLSTTGWRKNFFQASNDEGTPFDVTRNGGLYVHYKQLSQEFKLSSNPGGVVDYVTGIYLAHTESDASSRSRYGSDAGAWFANQTQYLTLDPLVPNTFSASGRALLKDSTDRLRKQTLTTTDNKTAAIYGKADWHLDEATGLPFTLGAGLRITRENRQTSQAVQVTEEGFGAALNAATQGGFNSNAAGVLGANSAAQLALANSVARNYFGAANYAALNATQRQQVAAAKAIRAAQRGPTSPLTDAEAYVGNIPTGVLSLSYKFNDGLFVYGTTQLGGKPGISQLVSTTNEAAKVKAETTRAYELGFRSASFGNTLIVVGDVFLQYLNDFQTTLSVYDPVQAAANPVNPYISLTGNVPQVTVKGLELDATYSGLPHTTLRFAGAYNNARYTKSVFLTGPEENGYLPANVFDAKGKVLPNAPAYSFNLSGDYRVPIRAGLDVHANANYHWQSSFYSTATLSEYSKVDPYGVLDLGVGVGPSNRAFDFTLLLKNAFNVDYQTSPTATSFVPSNPRWVGLMFTGKL